MVYMTTSYTRMLCLNLQCAVRRRLTCDCSKKCISSLMASSLRGEQLHTRRPATICSRSAVSFLTACRPWQDCKAAWRGSPFLRWRLAVVRLQHTRCIRVLWRASSNTSSRRGYTCGFGPTASVWNSESVKVTVHALRSPSGGSGHFPRWSYSPEYSHGHFPLSDKSSSLFTQCRTFPPSTTTIRQFTI